MAKYVERDALGNLIEVRSKAGSVGVGDAAKIVERAANGYIDITDLPPGVGAATKVAIGSEALTAGDWINIYDNAGTPNVRKANATDNTKPVNGFVLANFASGASVTAYLSGLNTQRTGMTTGVRYFGSTTPGGQVAAAGVAAGLGATGNYVQFLGDAESATEIYFSGTDRSATVRA
jgi:hypothetical protein